MATETSKPEYRGRIYDSILDTIGNTPLVRLPKLSPKVLNNPPQFSRGLHYESGLEPCALANQSFHF